MPKTEIDLPYRVEHLSILDEEGRLDTGLEPDLSADTLLRIYRTMVLARRFDERMLSLQRQGRIGTFPPVQGQEAQVGAAAALEPGDWLVPSFREMPAELWRGKSLESFLLLYGGFNEGGEIQDGLNNLPIAIPVGSQTLHAAGLGYAIQYCGDKHVAMTFFGDGATSEGDFHEAMNFAAVFQLPVIFVAQNNHWAISVPRSRQTHSRTLAQKALAYDMPGLQVDGNDVLAVYRASREAVDRARSGGGPTFIECITYRVSMHTTADDPKKYRTDDEVEPWRRRDPIIRFQKYLKARGILTDETQTAVDQEVQEEIKEAVNRWSRQAEAPLDPLDMFEYAYAQMPPHLLAQREELRQELIAGDTGDTH